MTTLVIVESPAKCGKIQEYLGKGYKVTSSMGHIRSLKEDLEAVGIERNWNPQYQIMPTKRKTVSTLQELAQNAKEVILATDDDREGEGIAFHICSVLKLDPLTTKRIIFHAITKTDIQNAINNPRTIDMNKFQSQQTRAMLDMLIGFTLSPVLWKQLNANGLPLSAGRCQTPALKLVLDRDDQITNHASAQFWNMTGEFTVNNQPKIKAQREKFPNDTTTAAYIKTLTSRASTLTTVKESERTHGAPKPLITSTLQQEASKTYGLSPKTTMSLAQKLYEAGHITYMRTDNAFLSPEGAAAARAEIVKLYGPSYEGPKSQHNQSKKAAPPSDAEAAKSKPKAKGKASQAGAEVEAQAAHEAIRPTHPEFKELPNVDEQEAKIYKLIWRRALQSQMATATEDARGLTFVIDNDPSKAAWYGEQIKSKFLGWKILDSSDKTDDKQTAAVSAWNAWTATKSQAKATWLTITAEEDFTKAASRYTEASLIHELETKGIGRPSTFASLVTTIVDRNYVEKSDSPGTQIDVRKWILTEPSAKLKEEKHKQTVGKESNKLQATALGRTVAEFIYKNYADMFDYSYTAKMESELDHIAKGARAWKTLLQENWDLYKDRYQNHIANAPEGGKQKVANKRDLGEGICVVLSRKGPLLLKEETKEFASLPPRTSFETVTLAQAKAAYKAKDGTELGSYDSKPILKKKGPYGFYAQWEAVKVPYKPEDTLEVIIAKIKQKGGIVDPASTTDPTNTNAPPPPFERKVGEFTIRRGPYGLYFFKNTAKKAAFASFPAAANENTVTEAELPELYTAALAAKKRRPPKK